MDFVDWMSLRCGGEPDDTSGAVIESPSKSLLEVIQTIALLSTIQAREGEQNVVTLSTLHAAKGLEWPHVVLAGCVEGLLPFRMEDDDGTNTDNLALRLQEERRLMYVGITRAQPTLAVNWLRRRKKGREFLGSEPKFAEPTARPEGAVRCTAAKLVSDPKNSLYRRDGTGKNHPQGRPARKAQSPARRVCKAGCG